MLNALLYALICIFLILTTHTGTLYCTVLVMHQSSTNSKLICVGEIITAEHTMQRQSHLGAYAALRINLSTKES